MRALSLAAALATFTTSVLAQSELNCTEGLYIIVARGTGEAEGTGLFGNIANEIASRVGHNSYVDALEYPASAIDPAYNTSEVDGVRDMRTVMTEYHEQCPKAKFAILGYSQGGQVTSDVFCGPSGDNDFSTAKAFPLSFVTKNVAAIVIFGDPSHVVDMPYDLGTSKNDGIFARNNTAFCEKNYSKLMRSYCDTGDIYCDSGSDHKVHGSYFKKYGSEVVDFVVAQYDALTGAKSSTTSTATSSAASTASSASASATDASKTDASKTGSSTDAASTTSASATPTSSKTSGSSGKLVPSVVLMAAVWMGLAAF